MKNYSTVIGYRGRSFADGTSVVISSVTADPLSYGESYKGRQLWERTPLPRSIRIEGYFLPESDDSAAARDECRLFRRLLSGIGIPDADAFVRMGDRTAYLTDVKLTFERSAPFSGESAESFRITALIKGGFFLGDSVSFTPHGSATGESLPYGSEGDVTFGTLDGPSRMRVYNGGDVPVGFTGEFSPTTPSAYFIIQDETYGRRLRVFHNVGADESVEVSTLRDSLEVTLISADSEKNLSGYATPDSVMLPIPVGESVIRVGGDALYTGHLTFREAYVWY